MSISPDWSGLTLALETSSSLGSWALFQDGDLLSESSFEGRASASLPGSLAPDLDREKPAARILVGVGPGSFSGVRVAVALAQGLRFAWKCPVFAVRSSHSLACQFSHVSFLGVFADAKRNQYFATCYELGVMTRPSQIIERSELEDWLGKCSLAVSPETLAGVPQQRHPRAADLVRYSTVHGLEPDLPLHPIYLRPALGP